MEKSLIVILPKKEYKIDKKNKIIYYSNDTFIYGGFDDIQNVNKIEKMSLSEKPSFFSSIKIFSIVLPIKELKNKNESFYFCFYNNKFILVPSEHLHALDNKYKYICSN